jgi:hypothetical protein
LKIKEQNSILDHPLSREEVFAVLPLTFHVSILVSSVVPLCHNSV